MATLEQNIKRLESALESSVTPDNFRPSMKQKLAELKAQKASEDKRQSEKKSKTRKQGGKKIKKAATKQIKSKVARRKPSSKLPKAVTKFNRGNANRERDRQRTALKPGKRISAEGNTYYETRKNHADVSRKHRLEKGGSTYNEGGKLLGKTKSGKPVYAYKAANDYKDFSIQDHIDAADIHYNSKNKREKEEGTIGRLDSNKRLGEHMDKFSKNKGGSVYNDGGRYDKGCAMNEHSDTCGCGYK